MNIQYFHKSTYVYSWIIGQRKPVATGLTISKPADSSEKLGLEIILKK